MQPSPQVSKDAQHQAFIPALTDSSNHERTLAGIVINQRDCGLNAKNQFGRTITNSVENTCVLFPYLF